MRLSLRETFLWGLLLVALFLLGWWRGGHPDFNLRRFLFTPAQAQILAVDSEWLTDDFIAHLGRRAGLVLTVERIKDFPDLEARVVVADAPPVLWIPLSWARALASQHLLVSFADDAPTRRKIHPDFLGATSDTTHLPLMWAPADRELRMEGLAVPAQTQDLRLTRKILAAWLETETALRQLRGTSAASALSASLEADLPADRKASALRNLSMTLFRGWK